jgi:hypothetical protein
VQPRSKPLSYVVSLHGPGASSPVPLPPRRSLQPPPQYAQARATQPIVPVSLWNERRAWLLTRYDDCAA